MPKGQRKYNGTQKVEIIKRIHRENLSFKGASREYGISDRTLRDWYRIALGIVVLGIWALQTFVLA